MLGSYGPICSMHGYTPKMKTTWSQLASSEDIYIRKCKFLLIIHNFQNFLGNFSQFILQVFENNLTHSKKRRKRENLGCWLGRGKNDTDLQWELTSPWRSENPHHTSPLTRIFSVDFCQFLRFTSYGANHISCYTISVCFPYILLLSKLPHAQNV